ncbi:hypothetical protein K505DRAFT_420833 [Melanomma pulvis-pyrius CBS 109.77]|uniref:Uncharacterized protein n=1 Tax=Melanomma pulvis-pyrius CBS 109.77 TaxID=1314802 RepID=A0A6A6WX81_9PLEO|nr:hypothetical protein K505DRAFT_420833 [Melanomma pulvis-pyrius CBS 109.77]
MAIQPKGKQSVHYALPDPPLEISPDPRLAGRRLTALDVTEGLRELAMDDDLTPKATSPATPTSVSTCKPNRRRQLSGDMIRTSRPKLRRKAATAPPGTLYLLSAAPQPPRRAISARVSRPHQNRNNHNRQSGLWSTPLPRLSLYGASASRSLITRRKSIRKSVGRLGLRDKSSVWRNPPATYLKKFQLISEALDECRKNSFSEKARVKDTLKNKNVEVLKMNIVDFNARELPDTPGSMGSTPRELYGKPDEAKANEPPPETGKRRMSSTKRAARFSLALSPDIQRCEWIARSSSVLTVRSVNKASHQQQVYMPGPIRLADEISRTPRGGLSTNWDLFSSEIEGDGESFSDTVELDGIVAYFQALRVVDEAAEDGMDKFWEAEFETSPTISSPPRPTAAPSMPARRPPLSAPSSRPGLPSPIRATRQQDERHPVPSPNLRQRIKIRRLLSSATSML